MTEQDCSQAPGSSLLMAEDTAVQLFQIAALMLGNEQEAVCLVEETVAKVETDPCAEATVAYAEARVTLDRVGTYRTLLIAADKGLPAATGNLDTDHAAAISAGAAQESAPIEVL